MPLYLNSAQLSQLIINTVIIKFKSYQILMEMEEKFFEIELCNETVYNFIQVFNHPGYNKEKI